MFFRSQCTTQDTDSEDEEANRNENGFKVSDYLEVPFDVDGDLDYFRYLENFDINHSPDRTALDQFNDLMQGTDGTTS